MAVNFLLDTNVAIDYIGGAFSAKASAFLDNIVENETAISVINQIEMLGFNPDDPRDLHP
ncbi:MAG: hypothetical protein JNK89_02875, partial [Saprospiraceae bacterium]|nr:hypothetical protein [Saprospiraceae bacterium]